MFVCLVVELPCGSVDQLADFAIIAMLVALISKSHVSHSRASRYILSWSATLFDLIIIYLVSFLSRSMMDSVLASATTTTTIIYGVLDKVYVLLLLGKLPSDVNHSYETNSFVQLFHVWDNSPINRSINLCGEIRRSHLWHYRDYSVFVHIFQDLPIYT